MYMDTLSDISTHLLGDSKMHITKFGRFLKKSSLDEVASDF